MHVHQMNFMIVSALNVFFGTFIIIHEIIGFVVDVSCWHYFFGMFTQTSFNIDVIPMQLDRFLAVYWNINYSGRVSKKMALISCLSSKVTATVVTLCVAYLDDSYGKCSADLALTYLKGSNIYLDAYPKLVVGCILYKQGRKL